MKIIDPHIHLFNLEHGEYHWLKAENLPFWPDKTKINKSFVEHDLLLTAPLELAGFVHIEAGFDNRQPWREIAWLEAHCHRAFSAIAAIDLKQSSADFNLALSTLLTFNSVVGVRHMLDNHALAMLTNQQVQQNIKQLNQKRLIFDVQMSLVDHDGINALCDIITDNQHISFIINHAGFPPLHLNSDEWQHWQHNLAKLSVYPNVALKCSGWEMINRQYQQPWLTAALAVCIATFGSQRVMIASNFPLCLFSHSYQDYWHNMVQIITSVSINYSDDLAEQLCAKNAKHWYQINA